MTRNIVYFFLMHFARRIIACELGVPSHISPLRTRAEGTMCLVATLSVLEGLTCLIRLRQRSGKILMSDGGLQMEQLPAEAYGDRHPSVSITCISPDNTKALGRWTGMCVSVPSYNLVFCIIEMRVLGFFFWQNIKCLICFMGEKSV